MTRYWDLVVLGRGILGTALAYLAAESGFFRRIAVLSEPSKDGLTADTLRNHSWWQSGLLYDDTTVFSAAQMFVSGVGLHESAGIVLPTSRGLFRMDYRGEESFLERARRLRLDLLIDRARDDSVRRNLGPFYMPGFVYYRVPDTTFDEAHLLTRLIARSRDLGVAFEFSKIDLVREPAAVGRFVIRTDHEVHEGANAVICCGAGTPHLLDLLAVDHPLTVFQSPLLNLRCGVTLGIPLFADLTQGHAFSGLSVVSHLPSTSDPDGCLVIGDRSRILLKPPRANERKVELPEATALEARLPTSLPLPPRGPRRRFTAGWKTEATRLGRAMDR